MTHAHTPRKKRAASRGFTLLELTIAMALFAVVLGATAQSLVTYHAALEMQNMRSVAAQNARSVLADMRSARDNGPFPEVLLNGWPDGAVVEGASTLPGENIVVTYTDVTANPLEVTVVSTFPDMRGRPVRVQLGTALTGE